MKKLSLIITMVLVLALSASTFAGSFADVPANHWAYEAVNELVAAGLIEGYPDGTFKGQNDLTRYEIATIMARLLNDIKAEREEMAADIDKAAHSLSKEEAKDVTAIVEALIEKNMPEEVVKETETIKEVETKVELPDNLLTAEEITWRIKALIEYFEPEIAALDEDLAGVMDEFKALDARVTALEDAQDSVSFSGKYSVDYEEIVSSGGTAWLDPYTKDYDDDDDEDADDQFDADTQSLKQEIALGMDIKKGALEADLDLTALVDNFDGVADTTALELDSLSGTITGNDFVATIANSQAPGYKSYLLSDSTDDDDDLEYPVNGVVVETLGNKYAIVYDEDAATYILAGNGGFSVLGQDVNVAYGVENLAEGTKIVAFDTELDVAGFTVTPELALNDTDLEDKYFTLGVTGDLAGIDTEFNFANITGFTAIAGSSSDKEGFDVTGKKTIGAVDVEGSYEAYSVGGTYTAYAGNVMEIKGEIVEDNALDIGGFSVTANGQYRAFGDETAATYADATRQAFGVTASNTFGKVAFEGKLDYANETDGYFEIMKLEDNSDEFDDGDYTAATDKFDKSADFDYSVTETLTTGALLELDKDNELTTTLDAAYDTDKLDATGEMVMPPAGDTEMLFTADYVLSEELSAGAEMANTDVAAGSNWRNKFTAEYEKGIVTADFTMYMNDADNNDDMVINGYVTPDAVEMAGFALSPYAEAGFKLTSPNNQMNYLVGVDAEKALSEYATFTGKYEYANKEFGVDLPGLKVTQNFGVDYSITEDLAANLNYENLTFEDDGTNDYNVKKASVGVELSF